MKVLILGGTGQIGSQVALRVQALGAEVTILCRSSRSRELAERLGCSPLTGNLSAPEQSLLLMKATQQLPHEGGSRFDAGSPEYQTIVAWIEQGMVYRLPDEPELESIALAPPAADVAPGQRGAFKVVAKFSNGTARDVTALADFSASDETRAAVDEAGAYQIGDRTGEAVVTARYLGEVAVATLRVPPERTLPDDAYAGLPRHNFIDDLAIARWQALGLFPSDLCTDAEFHRRAALSLIAMRRARRPPERARLRARDSAPQLR